MSIVSAENAFKKGLASFVEGRYIEAAQLFNAAIRTEKERGVGRPQMRYLSYYGLSMARAHGATPDAIRACETAARRDFFNPDLQLNLGRVYMLAGRTHRAFAALERGLKLAPRHRALVAELERFERRRMPVIPGLRRDHSLNILLGRLRHRLRSRNVPEASLARGLTSP